MAVYKQDSASADSDPEVDEPPDPSREKMAAFIGYRAFPPVMNLYGNLSGIVSALTTLKLCGASESDLVYLVELHFGFTPRGPLNFGRGYYLRNGTTMQDPVLAAAGDNFPLPLVVSLFSSETVVLLPPLDTEKNPRDMVTEVMRSSASKEQGVAFRFAVEVGVQRWRREEFEWRKMKKGDGDEKGSRYTLFRIPFGLSGAASSSSTPVLEESSQIVAEVVFRNILSMKHICTLELKGAGLTGELGERWILMVVMTVLGLYWMRQNGRTKRATVAVAEKMHEKQVSKG
ncbi:hypothetical protein C8A01DRAFT_17692 [Parachaetomium inaequale]|uniref:Uncharacterized protein n=1 Tax=Parachaetomium inaequale TaxID=2588326 RepID=A0AAN6SPU3_9PEZI|nr:hypothetical protein C8A01DRAFT_17692 [Parachaetomium inaequale]